MRKPSTLFIFLFVLVISSCSKKFYYLDAHQTPLEEASQNDSLIIQSSFAGDAFDYIVFEVTLKNKTSDTVSLSYTDINLIVFENEENDDPVLFHALNKDDIIYDIQHQHRQVERDKKTSTTLNIIGVGLDLIGIAATGNVSTAEAIIYSAESAGYILQERRAFQLVEGSLQDQMDYIEQWVLENDYVAPGESRSWDILFERVLVNTDASLEIFCEDFDFHFDYRFQVIEEKY
jgi:hypothetical protein